MQFYKLLALAIFTVLALMSCETPNKPDFQVVQKFEFPLLQPKKYFFLGGSDAFIDTTKGKTDTLFAVGADNVVFISFTDSVEIGDLDDAIPSIDVDPSTVESEVGVIEVDDFSSTFRSAIGVIEQSPEGVDDTEAEIGNVELEFSGSGASSFNEITGQNPPAIASPIPASSNIITIDLAAGSFVYATIVSGGLAVEFTNNLGFTIANLTAQLISDSDASAVDLGTPLVFSNIAHTNTVSGVITFTNGDVLQTDLQIRIYLDWVAQTYIPNSLNDLRVSASESNLVVSQAVAEVPSQALTPNTPDIVISDPGFNSVTLSTNTGTNNNVNQLVLTVTNNTNIPLTNADLSSFPTLTLRNGNGTILDETKTLSPLNPSGNALNAGEKATVTFNLAGQTLTKTLSYTLDLGTAGSSGGSISVAATDNITITATTTDLEVSSANAVIDPQDDIELSDEATVEGDFARAEVETGSLTLTFTNTLPIPMTLESLSIYNRDAFVTKNTNRYVAAGTEIGNLSNIVIPANSSVVEEVDLSGRSIGDVINFDAVASSEGSNGATVALTENDEISITVEGSISVNEAEAKLSPQDFSSNDVIEIDKENFEFSSPEHFVKLKSGELVIEDLINGLDVGLDTLKISVPAIQDANGNPLILGFYGNTQQGTIYPAIQRKENGSRAPIVVNLAGYSIKAPNNEVAYNVFGKTEDTNLSNDPFRTIRSTDKVSATLRINNLEIKEALGKVVKKEVLLGDDDLSNGEDILDIANPNEAEVIENDGLDDISEKLENLQLSGTNLSIQYTTNIGIEANVIMAIAGEDKDGNLFFLQGANEFAVTPQDSVTKLYYNGAPIPISNLVKFSFGENATAPVTAYPGSINFNAGNSNVDEFLSNLPSKIRTLGIAVVNPNSENSSYVSNPIEFKTELSIDIPLSISTTEGPISITEDLGEIDFFADIPEKDEDVTLEEFAMQLKYENGLPLAINVQFEFFNATDDTVIVDYQPIILEAAPIDANGFTTGANSGTAELFFTDVNQLKAVTRMNLKLEVETTNRANVRIRTTDFISIGISASSTGSFSQK